MLPWKGSALVDRKIRLPKKRNFKQMSKGIPLTYVPARNTIFLSFALSWAETLRAHSVWIGANAIDYSGYPDCRGNYLKAMEKVFRLGTKAGGSFSIYDLKGAKVASRSFSAGASNRPVWNGKNDQGKTVPAGVYLVRLRTLSGKTQMARVVFQP